MHYPAHLAKLLAMQKDASDRPAPRQQEAAPIRPVLPSMLPGGFRGPGAPDDNVGRMAWARARLAERTRARLAERSGLTPGAGPAPGLKDTSITVSPRTLPYYPDKEPSRRGEPGAGPAPGHYFDHIAGTLKRFPDDEPSRTDEAPVPRKTLRRYAPIMRTPPQQSPAPMRDVDERMPTPRAIPFERMERLPPRRRDSY